MKKILNIIASLLAVSALMLSLGACGGDNEEKKCAHIDADDDFKCDECGEDYDDGLEVAEVKTVDVKFTVKVVGGDVLSGVKFTVTKGSKSIDLVSDENGNATAELKVSTGKKDVYSVTYSTDELPEYHLPSTYEFLVYEDATDITLEIVNNAPDGTEAHPFFLGESKLTETVDAGVEIFYTAHGSSDGHLEVTGENIIVNYNGSVYTPDSGVITVTFDSALGESAYFSIENTGSSASTATLELVYPLGSSGNPIVITSGDTTAEISEKGGSVHYIWTADKDGILLISSENTKNNISAVNRETNAATIQTMGKAGAYLAVKVGDAVSIDVSFSDGETSGNVDFNLAVYLGTAADPLPVVLSELEISLEAGASITYTSEAGKNITISDASSLTLTNGETQKEANSLNMISHTLAETGVFTVTNNSEEKMTVKITIS